MPSSEIQEATPLSSQLMSEFLTGYKQTETYQAARKIQDKKDAIGRMYAGYDYYQDLRVHPEKIYEEMQDTVEYNLHGGGLKPNAWLELEFLEGKHDAIQFISAWEPVGREYGNAIFRSLHEEDLAKNNESLDQVKDRLKKAEAENREEMERRKNEKMLP